MGMNKVYASFQHYDHKGRRLSIFGTPFPDGSGMEIMVFRCNKKDVFKKKFAWSAYRLCKNAGTVKLYGEGMNPELEAAPFTSKKEFIKYCNQRFYKIQYYYAYIPGIPIEMDITGKYGGTLLKKKGGAIIKYLSREKIQRTN